MILQLQSRTKKIGTQRTIILFAIFFCFLLTACGVSEEDGLLLDELTKQASEQNETISEEPNPQIVVYICGAVKQPGVYSLAKGSRIAQALELAGGFDESAAREYVNLAAVLTDGEQIYFPKEDEALKLLEEEERKEQGLVNINTATLEELMTLTGIGESRAKDILAYRTANGAFESVEDLMNVPGIKENTFNRFKDKIYVE